MTQPIRRDPSGSRSVERLFAKNLQALVGRYGAECRAFVIKHQGRALESPVQKLPMNAEDLITSIQHLVGITISQHASPIAEAAAILAYQHGKNWADKGLTTAGAINPATGAQKIFYLPPERRAIEKIKARNMMEINGMTDELAKKMSRSMVEGFEAGETMNKLTSRVNDVTRFGKFSAERIARTETMRAINGAAVDRYRSFSVEKVEFLAAWDDRVCPECESKHGTIYPIESAPVLPLHPNCRCTLAPVIDRE